MSGQDSCESRVEPLWVIKVNVMARPVHYFELSVGHCLDEFPHLRVKHPVPVSKDENEGNGGRQPPEEVVS